MGIGTIVLIGLGVLALLLVLVAIGSYPKDNSF